MVKSIFFSFMTALKFCQNHSSNTSFSALTTAGGGRGEVANFCKQSSRLILLVHIKTPVEL